jgi:hypothetical protein
MASIDCLFATETHLELDDLVQQDEDGCQMGKVPCRNSTCQPVALFTNPIRDPPPRTSVPATRKRLSGILKARFQLVQ